MSLIVLKATAFLVASLFLGVRLSPILFRFAFRLQARGVSLALRFSLARSARPNRPIL